MKTIERDGLIESAGMVPAEIAGRLDVGAHETPAEPRDGLLAHLAGDNLDSPATEWCDRHGGYVDEGRTRPYATGSRYRICDACSTEAARMVAERQTFCPDCDYLMAFHVDGRCPEELGPAGARARAGD